MGLSPEARPLLHAGRSGIEVGRDLVIGSSMDRITFDPQQCGGRPCIRGMRIRVKDVLEMLAAGTTEATILTDFPYLEQEDIRACLKFAAAEMDHSILRAA